MTRREIHSRFDEIVEFAGIEQFLDTPTKRYSSGMYVRLGFAVAVHFDPEVVVIDEVLAVGDANFQAKSLAKMSEAATSGRTILLGSHQMSLISGMCHRVCVLDGGKITFTGSTDEAIGHYLSISKYFHSTPLHERHDRSGTGQFRFTNVFFTTTSDKPSETLVSGMKTNVVLDYESATGGPLKDVAISIPFYSDSGQNLFMCWTRAVDQDFRVLPPRGRIVAEIDRLPLRAGRYTVHLYAEANGSIADWIEQAAWINITEGDFFGTGSTPPSGHGISVVAGLPTEPQARDR